MQLASLVIPQPLRRGDTVGFVSPSAGVDPRARHRIERAVRMCESLGYRVRIAPHALGQAGYVSASIADRVADIHEMFRDPAVRLVMCTIGGNNSNQLLPHLDYELIRTNPKIFMGYSDITVLHYALASQAGLATYYGPCAMTQFGEFPKILDYTLDHFLREVAREGQEVPYRIDASPTWTQEFIDWFKQEDNVRPRTLLPNDGYEWLVPGIAEGPALGGAILSVNHIAGTKYWMDPAGSTFFLDILKTAEELNEGAVDAFLTDLQNLGVFDVVHGLVIGRPADYTPDETDRLKQIILRCLGTKKCPVLFRVNIGHTDPIITLRYGRRVRLDSSRNEFSLL